MRLRSGEGIVGAVAELVFVRTAAIMDVNKRAVFTQLEAAVIRLPGQHGRQVIPFPIEIIIENAGIAAVEALSCAATNNGDRVAEGNWAQAVRCSVGRKEEQREKCQQVLRNAIHDWILIFM